MQFASYYVESKDFATAHNCLNKAFFLRNTEVVARANQKMPFLIGGTLCQFW